MDYRIIKLRGITGGQISPSSLYPGAESYRNLPRLSEFESKINFKCSL